MIHIGKSILHAKCINNKKKRIPISRYWVAFLVLKLPVGNCNLILGHWCNRYNYPGGKHILR